MASTVAAVIPVHNRKALTLTCLDRLRASRQEGFDLRVIVVDDGSTDGTASAISASHPSVEVLSGDGNLWWAGGMNLGVRRALAGGANYILCLNDDVEFDEGLVAGLMAAARARPGALLAPVGVYHDNGEILQSGYRFVRWRGFTAVHALEVLPEQPYPVEALAGNCVLVPVEAYRRVGLYASEALPQYHADLEFCVRAGRAGIASWVFPGLTLRIRRNTKNADLLNGALTVRALRYMFTHPNGIYAPRAYFEFCQRTHPHGRLAGTLQAMAFFPKAMIKVSLNLSGLARLFQRTK